MKKKFSQDTGWEGVKIACRDCTLDSERGSPPKTGVAEGPSIQRRGGQGVPGGLPLFPWGRWKRGWSEEMATK